MYAMVEESNLGLATVRLGGTGSRMTNLSTVGGQVQAGDTVIVDWSAGVDPIVRPLFLADEEEIQLGLSVPESPVDDEDISTFQDTYISTEDPTFITQGVPYLWRGGRFDHWEHVYYQEYWDSANIVNNSSIFGDEYMNVPRDGKYLIGMVCYELFVHNRPGPDGYLVDNVESQCHYRIRIIKNNSIPIAVGTGQWSVGWSGGPGINIASLEPLEAGDQISFEIYFTSTAISSWWIDNYGFYPAESRSRWLIYVPGT
jgi:hypothetical protein